MPHDWRPPRDEDWQRLIDLLSCVAMRLRFNADAFEQAEKDLRALGGENRWSIDISRYADRAARDRQLAAQVEDELGALQGGHQRQVPLYRRGMFSA